MKKIIVAVFIAAIVAACAVGCGDTSSGTSDSTTSQSSSSQEESTVVSSDSVGNSEENSQDEEDVDMFSDRDLVQEVDLAEATVVTLNSQEDVELTEEGIYLVSGEVSNVTINVNVTDEEKVQIVLDGLAITNEEEPAINVESADKVFITTTDDSENNLTVTGEEAQAVIYAKDDLTINGLGTLNLTSASNGIEGKDDLKITGGNINIVAANKGIKANDSIRIYGGNITIDANDDGLNASNSDDTTLGWVYIWGGDLEISSGDDGIHGEAGVTIDGGVVDIASSVEGIEGKSVVINDGDVTVNASDDGINATDGSESGETAQEGVKVEINGGVLTVVMGSGDTDAIDSNGDIYVNGGTVDLTCTSSFDSNGEAVLSGGTVTVNGEIVTEITQEKNGGRK